MNITKKFGAGGYQKCIFFFTAALFGVADHDGREMVLFPAFKSEFMEFRNGITVT
jgi:hypothetical protein